MRVNRPGVGESGIGDSGRPGKGEARHTLHDEIDECAYFEWHELATDIHDVQRDFTEGMFGQHWNQSASENPIFEYDGRHCSNAETGRDRVGYPAHRAVTQHYPNRDFKRPFRTGEGHGAQVARRHEIVTLEMLRRCWN